MILRNLSVLKNNIRKVLHSSKNSKFKHEKCLHKKIEIIVIRTDTKGNLKNSKPCTHCLDTLKLFNVKCIYYSNDYGQIIKERLDNLEQHRLSGGQKNLYKFYRNEGVYTRQNKN